MLDITFDLETCALCPTAAVMSFGAVAWDRNKAETPFFHTDANNRELDADFVFSFHVDLRSMFLDGFTFDQNTAKWWSEQSADAKKSLLDWDTEDTPCMPIETVVKGFIDWIGDVMRVTGEKDVCLWSQGADFDIAILRNICNKYDITLPISYKNFRDHRTFFLEGAHTICDIAGIEFDPSRAYTLVDELDVKGGAPHDPVFDCQRSIYATWQMMKHLRCFKKVSDIPTVGMNGSEGGKALSR